MVGIYHTELVEAGLRDYSLETLRRDIKLGILNTFLSVILGGVNADFSSERGRQLIRAWIERNIAILEDHDVWEALA